MLSHEKTLLGSLNSLTEGIYELFSEDFTAQRDGLNGNLARYFTEFKILKSLANSKEWPKATPEFLICKTEQEKLDRAEGVLELLDADLENKKLLDFGCGEGHVAVKSNDFTALSTGYETQQSGKLNWEQNENYLLTTDLRKIKQLGPYDVIIAYDILDRFNLELSETLSMLKSMLTDQGQIFVRFKPWCGRHGCCQNNKAYFHLVFTDEELVDMGLKPQKYKKIIHPLSAYEAAIEKADLVKDSEHVERMKIEEFFYKNKIVRNRIQRHWTEQDDFSHIPGEPVLFPLFQTEQSFVYNTLIQ